mgnify:CR=1 FL=1|jgi:hypothetical protein
MKTVSGGVSIFVFGAVIGGPWCSAQPGRQTAESPTKAHTLFMGVDLAIEHKNMFRRVREVSGSSWVVNVEGRPEFIPANKQALKIKVEQSLKLSEARATLGDLKTERTYAPGRDPGMEAMRTQLHLGAFTTERQMVAERELSRELNRASWATTLEDEDLVPRVGPPPDPVRALDDLETAADLAQSQMTTSQFNQAIADEQSKKELFDAILVEFDISAPKPLANPYMIVVAQFREKGAPASTARNWIYAQMLDYVDETPRRVSMRRGGLPPGYELDKVNVHVYDQGREVATNVSPKRVELTREEAFQYIVIEHIGNNKGQTLPAMPVMATLTPEVRTRLREGEGQQVYYVNVSKDGLVTDAFEDEGYSKRIADPFFAEVVRRVWFKPALKSGKPVEAKTSVDFTEFL